MSIIGDFGFLSTCRRLWSLSFNLGDNFTLDRSLVGELRFLSTRRQLWSSFVPLGDDFTLDHLALSDFVRLFARRLDLACYEDLVPIGGLKCRSIP